MHCERCLGTSPSPRAQRHRRRPEPRPRRLSGPSGDLAPRPGALRRRRHPRRGVVHQLGRSQATSSRTFSLKSSSSLALTRIYHDRPQARPPLHLLRTRQEPVLSRRKDSTHLTPTTHAASLTITNVLVNRARGCAVSRSLATNPITNYKIHLNHFISNWTG